MTTNANSDCTCENAGDIGKYVTSHVLVFGRPFAKWFALCYRTVVLSLLSCLYVTLVYYGQTVGWIKMKLGMQVGLGSATLY